MEYALDVQSDVQTRVGVIRRYYRCMQINVGYTT